MRLPDIQNLKVGDLIEKNLARFFIEDTPRTELSEFGIIVDRYPSNFIKIMWFDSDGGSCCDEYHSSEFMSKMYRLVSNDQ